MALGKLDSVLISKLDRVPKAVAPWTPPLRRRKPRKLDRVVFGKLSRVANAKASFDRTSRRSGYPLAR